MTATQSFAILPAGVFLVRASLGTTWALYFKGRFMQRFTSPADAYQQVKGLPVGVRRKVEVREEAPAPTTYRIKIVLHDGTVKLSAAMGDHEFTDRLAKECQRDPTVKSAEAVAL